MKRRYVTTDVFTDRMFGGNPLAVVLDAEGLSGTEMQAIALEFNYSETTFVLPPDDPANTAKVRIFTPRTEVPFAGHPNVGTAFVLAHKMREAMSADGTLHLIDPFHLSRFSALNFMKRAAHGTVASCSRGKVLWIEKFSYDAIREWSAPIDLIVIDGDHSDAGVERDWNDWSRFVKPGGVVIFHDACLFPGGWTRPDYGPVKLVNRLFRANLFSGWSIAEEVHSLLVVERHSK